MSIRLIIAAADNDEECIGTMREYNSESSGLN